jgi:DNA replication protein DnaC
MIDLAKVQAKCAEYAAQPEPEHVRKLSEHDSKIKAREARDWVMRHSAIPVRYREFPAGFEIDLNNQLAYEATQLISQSGFVTGVGLFGGAGIGKSQMASVVALEAIDRGIPAKMFTPEGLLARVFDASTYGGEEAVADVMRDIALTPVLILDDLGSEALSRQKLAWLYEILNSRWNAGRNRCLIVTSNVSFGDLLVKYATIAERAGDKERGEAIMDRIRALAWPWIEMLGDSRRGTP